MRRAAIRPCAGLRRGRARLRPAHRQFRWRFGAVSASLTRVRQFASASSAASAAPTIRYRLRADRRRRRRHAARLAGTSTRARPATWNAAEASAARLRSAPLARLAPRQLPTSRVPVLFAPEMARSLIGSSFRRGLRRRAVSQGELPAGQRRHAACSRTGSASTSCRSSARLALGRVRCRGRRHPRIAAGHATASCSVTCSAATPRASSACIHRQCRRRAQPQVVQAKQAISTRMAAAAWAVACWSPS